MTKKMWGLSILAAGALVGGGLFWAHPSDAALPIRPIVTTCQTQAAMSHYMSISGGPVVTAGTPGSLSAGLSAPYTTSDGRTAQDVTVTSLLSQGDVQGLGPVTIQLDTTRDAGPGAIVANQKEAAYPATQRMTFYITVDANGQQFRSLEPVTLISTNVTSTPPAIGTTFDLATKVDFDTADKPGEVAMTMQPGQAAIIQGHDKV